MMVDPVKDPTVTPTSSEEVGLYYQFGKLLIWIVGAVISLFITILAAALAIPGVRQDIVKNLIVDAQAETQKYLNSEEGNKALEGEIDTYLRSSRATQVVDDEMRKYLSDESGNKILENEIDRYLHTTKAASIVDNEFEEYLKSESKGQAFDTRFALDLNNVMSKVIAYSYSIAFAISEDKKSYNLRYIKPDGNKGMIECNAIYPNNSVRNAVYFVLNFEANPAGQIVPKPHSHLGSGVIHLPEKSSDPNTNSSANQNATIYVDDATPFQGSIWLECTVTIFGPPIHISQ
jgi:hypothetical protein